MENLGLVGFTGAGANRLFAALTGLDAPSEYEAAVAVATVPDERLDRLAAMSESKKVVPAGFELVHLALPPGAKPGEGLGAKFLGSLRNCDAILIVLRAFDADSGVGGGVTADPAGDLAAIELELVLADLGSVEQRVDRQRRAAKSGDKEIAAEVQALERAHAVLSEGTPIARSALSTDDQARLAPVFLLTTKPLLLVANTGEDPAPTAAVPDGSVIVPVDIEAEIAACAPADRDEMRETYGLGASALATVANAAYHLLGRRTFLTTGDKESRAWTFRAGAKAPECAGVIHSDLQRGFIRAEVIRWDELLEIGSWSKARELGKLRVEGKDYEVADGDVLEIRFNV
jgi:ribosome-binding ATPase